MKKLFLILLFVLIGIQLLVPLQMIRSREMVLHKGELFRFVTRPIDPADPFQGRYVRLGIARNYVPGKYGDQSPIKRRTPVYASVRTGEDDFAEFYSLSLEKPEDTAFIRTRHAGRHYTRDAETEKSAYAGERIEIPFNRFYMEESKAPRAERLAAAASLATNCWVNVRIYKGTAVIEDVFAEGISLRELAAEKDEKMALP